MATRTRTALQTQIDTLLPDNNVEAISAADTRSTQTDLNDSNFNLNTDDSDDITEGASNLFLTTSERTLISTAEQAANKGAANGYASLGADSKVPAAQIPDIAVSDYLGSVANQTAMLALTGEKGDWCTRSDTGTNFIITGSDPSVIGGWTELSYPTAPVTSVNSATGVVVLDADDIAETASRVWLDTGEQTISGEKTFSEGVIGWRPVVNVTTSDNLDTVEANKMSVCNTTSGAIVITVNDAADSADAIGTEYEFFHSVGGNTVTFAVTGSQAIISKDSNVQITGIGSAAVLKKIAANTWMLVGDLA
jgi:hypothetical protein